MLAGWMTVGDVFAFLASHLVSLAVSWFGEDERGSVGPVLLLCGLKAVLDVWFHLRERRRAREGRLVLRTAE